MSIVRRNLERELNHAGPAFAHCQLGTLISELITKHNTIANVVINPTKISLGSPVALSTNALISAATSTELPSNSTITYTTANDNTSPVDGSIAAPSSVTMADGAAHLVWVLDVPRNLTFVVTHGTTTVLMDITVTGFDYLGLPLVETTTLTSGATPQAFAGKKAFKYIYSFAIHAAGVATTNTLNVGFGDVLGLPVALTDKSDLLQTWYNQILEATVPTIVLADATTVSPTTGDPRGTINLNTTINGLPVRVWMNTQADFGSAYTLTALSDR